VTLVKGPRIGIIEFFGMHKTPEAKVREALGVKEGDFLPRSKGDAEDRIDHLPGVVEAHLEGVCCENGGLILYVGMEEKGGPHFDLREPPDTDIQLPEEVTKLYRRFLEGSQKSARFTIEEDLTQGHALSADRDTRELQEQFVPEAKQYLPELRHVLHDSADEVQRGIAVYVLGYYPNKIEIVDDLQYALKDSDQAVRSNASRGLKALAVYARLHPASEFKVEPTWFIEMLNSLSVADRVQALAMLQILTDNRDSFAMDQMRERGLVSLVDMARWKSLSRALPAFVLVGRLTELTDQQVQDAWAKGDREAVIAQALATVKKKK
jgi:hypothetical protein